MGKKVGFAAVFMDIIRSGALPEEAFIHTAEMTAIKNIKDHKRYVICTDTQSSRNSK